jgi:hypothetical protein
MSGAKKLLSMSPHQFAEGSAERLLWRICASHRCPGLINGEAVLCEAFHAEALDVLTRRAAVIESRAPLSSPLCPRCLRGDHRGPCTVQS